MAAAARWLLAFYAFLVNSVLLDAHGGSHGCEMRALADLHPGVVTRMCPPDAGPTACADGSPFSFLVRKGSGAGAQQRKVVLDFMGGGWPVDPTSTPA